MPSEGLGLPPGLETPNRCPKEGLCFPAPAVGNPWVLISSIQQEGGERRVNRRTASWVSFKCSAVLLLPCPGRYVTLCVVVQQGGEAEGDRPCGCPKGEVPATLPAAIPPPGKALQ